MPFRSEWIVRPRLRTQPRLRLFCFPYAGVGPSAFRGWPDGFDTDVEVCIIQLPGREARLREPPFRSMKDLVPQLANGLMGLLDRPYAFYGHSLGARTAFETVRALRRSAYGQPFHLFVGACQAPQIPWPHSHMHHLDESAFLAEVQKRYGGVPSQIMDDPDVRALLLPAMRADIAMLETYEYLPEQPLACAITAFGGAQDRMVTQSSVDDWRYQTSADFRVMMFAGDHFFMQSSRTSLLESIAADMKQTSAFA